MFIIVHTLSCTASFHACHGNVIGFEVAKKESWLFTERGLGFDLIGFETAGSGTRTRDLGVSSPAL